MLCTDKTGTLTENRITLVYHVDAERNTSEQVLLYSYLNSYYQTGLKSPLDQAILQKSGVEIGHYRKSTKSRLILFVKGYPSSLQKTRIVS